MSCEDSSVEAIATLTVTGQTYSSSTSSYSGEGLTFADIEKSMAVLDEGIRSVNDPIAAMIERQTGMRLDRKIFAEEMVLAPWTCKRVVLAAWKASIGGVTGLEAIWPLLQLGNQMEYLQRQLPRNSVGTWS